MRRIFLTLSILAVVLATGLHLGAAQPQPGRLGFHSVTLPRPPAASARNTPEVLLETAHLKLVSIVVPNGGVLPAHSAPSQVSILALSGSGELIAAGQAQRIDAAHMIVLAPGLEHEVRAAKGADLVLLIHHVLPGPRGRGQGPRTGRGPSP